MMNWSVYSMKPMLRLLKITQMSNSSMKSWMLGLKNFWMKEKKK